MKYPMFVSPGSILYTADVHPQVLFCRNSAVVQVKRGKGLLREVSWKGNWSQLCIGNQPLYTSHIDHTGSYRDIIRLGYPNSWSANDILQDSISQVNAPYTNLQTAIAAITPLLNLLERGTYLVSDFDLFPVQKPFPNKERVCFWNVPDRDWGYWPFSESSEWAGGSYPMNRHPLYPVPTQPARCMNPSRTEHYRHLLKADPERIPRAIGLYLRGSAVLLLDGHHKVLAAAAEGVPAKTLVISRLSDEREVFSALEQKNRLYLRRTSQSSLFVCDSGEAHCSSWAWFGEKKKPDVNQEFFYEPLNPDSWGSIDEKWFAEMQNPALMKDSVLRKAAELSVQTIKEQIAFLQKQPPDELYRYTDTIQQLLYYASANPDNKWITPAQLQWLKDS